jgi:hypothetical protein
VNYCLNTIKLLERKNKLAKMFFSQKQAQVSLLVIVIATEEEEILSKVVEEANIETIVKAEATVKEEGIFKVEETIKAEDIFMQKEIVKVEVLFKATIKEEDKLHPEIKVGAEDKILEDKISAEGETSIKLFAEGVTKSVIMQKIVALPSTKSPSFNKTQHNLLMIDRMMIQNMCLPHLQH